MTNQNAPSPNLQRGDRVEELSREQRIMEALGRIASNGFGHPLRTIHPKRDKEMIAMMGYARDTLKFVQATRQSPEAVTDELVEALTFAHRTLVDHRIARALREDARMGGAADMVSKVVNKTRAALLKVSPPK